jgi:hypothetical protein
MVYIVSEGETPRITYTRELNSVFKSFICVYTALHMRMAKLDPYIELWIIDVKIFFVDNSMLVESGGFRIVNIQKMANGIVEIIEASLA